MLDLGLPISTIRQAQILFINRATNSGPFIITWFTKGIDLFRKARFDLTTPHDLYVYQNNVYDLVLIELDLASVVIVQEYIKLVRVVRSSFPNAKIIGIHSGFSTNPLVYFRLKKAGCDNVYGVMMILIYLILEKVK